MNWKQVIVRLAAASAALWSPTRVVWGQSCQCGTSFVPLGDPVSENQKLPAGWPPQWSLPVTADDAVGTTATIADVRVRDPFSGQMIPANMQTRMAGTATKTAADVSTRIAKTESVQSSQRNSAVGGSVGGGTGGFGQSGAGATGSFSGGTGGNTGSAIGGASSWSARSGSNSGGAVGGGSTGKSASSVKGSTLLAQSAEKSKSASSGSGSSSKSGGSGSVPSGNPKPGGDLTEIDPPASQVPDSTPEIPDTNGPGKGGGDIVPGGPPTDSPVVPEPGSIILIGIASGLGGAGWLRRRMKQRVTTTDDDSAGLVVA